ncbi:M24 family metallopeptidase [Brevibacillus fulvus]|uniref:Xaa-Pro aminopeptidase n=1 Tax=Brevibacillus fulvus TaxID=1125967 RepID=A0A939BUA3_9BACL|nr:aminopeptidase P family protein [Brevibacillus fulvus]MBM7590284.1 Xaa-Pro aminopeptidase [Brevibacillus fulvus]
MVSQPLEKLRVFLSEHNLDGVLFRKRSNFSWVTGGKDNHIVLSTELGAVDLLILQEKKICIATKMEAARIQEEELAGLGYEFVTPEWYEGQDEAIRRLCNGKRIASDVPFDGLREMGQALAQLRYTLTREEQVNYQWLCQATARAVESTCREIEPGWSEHEIAAHMAAKVLKQGIQPQVILVSTDDRVFKYRHPIPTEKKLEKYAMLVLCGEKGGLVANVTRFVHFGPLPAELAQNRLKLAQIDAAMNAATRPGVLIKDVFARGLEMYAEVGYPEDWRFLHQGGPTGYASREFLAVPDVEGVVQLHQAFAWNPAIRGVKSEDTLLVGEEGNQFLTETGEWVYIEVEQNGARYRRPDILVR